MKNQKTREILLIEDQGERMNVLFETAVTWVADYLKNNKLNSMVLGISGGIDSTVVSAICSEVESRTGIPFIARSLPIKNKTEEKTTADLVGEAFSKNYKVVPLNELYNQTLISIYQNECNSVQPSIEIEDELHCQLGQTKLANGNIQARLRMIYLYNLAGISSGLVMDTDNLTEHNLGFFTIHGDEGDLNPIGNLWKMEVYELAKWLSEAYYKNDLKKSDAIKTSIQLVPTDGNGVSSSDLEQIGGKSYEEVDEILKHYLSGTLDQISKEIPKEVVERVINRHNNSNFKRTSRPIKL